jgi:uncharacterized membrane protein
MWTNTVAIDIHASPEVIYAYLVDFTRHAEWSSNVRRIELTAGEVGKVGAEYRASEDTPRDLTSFAQITQLRPPNLIAWESTDKRVFKTRWMFEIEQQGDASRLTQRVTFEPLNLPAYVILYLFRVPRVERENRASLERIKKILEQ